MPGAVTFVTLFLNLTTGSHPVAVAVEGDVAQVELVLDGELVGRTDGEPWTVECDFGSDLEPHELVAIGRDASGREVVRARQLVNLPRPRAEARLALEDDDAGPPRRARLTWDTVENLAPQSIEVTFDDRPLEIGADRRIDLPPYDPRQPHFLSARLTFAGELEARTTTSFGGGLGARLDTELTALPIVPDSARQPPPSAEAMQGWFYKGPSTLPVFAVERNAAEVLLVVDRRAWETLHEIVRRNVRWAGRFGGPRYKGQTIEGMPRGLRKGDSLRFVATTPQLLNDATPPRWLFPVSKDANTRNRESIVGVLARARPPADEAPQRIADAVAVAAGTAVAGERPRAVVLILRDGSQDLSGVSARAVREYLRKLRVPLHVWRTHDPGTESPWGEGVEITLPGDLRTAIKDLRQELDDQLMVWLEGSHLPHHVELRQNGWKIAG